VLCRSDDGDALLTEVVLAAETSPLGYPQMPALFLFAGRLDLTLRAVEPAGPSLATLRELRGTRRETVAPAAPFDLEVLPPRRARFDQGKELVELAHRTALGS
jgi:hypothetical protein